MLIAYSDIIGGTLFLPNYGCNVDSLAWAIDRTVGKQRRMLALIFPFIIAVAPAIVHSRQIIVCVSICKQLFIIAFLQSFCLSILQRMPRTGIHHLVTLCVIGLGLHQQAHAWYKIQSANGLGFRLRGKLHQIYSGRQSAQLGAVVEHMIFIIRRESDGVRHGSLLDSSFHNLPQVITIIRIQLGFTIQLCTPYTHCNTIQTPKVIQQNSLLLLRHCHLMRHLYRELRIDKVWKGIAQFVRPFPCSPTFQWLLQPVVFFLGQGISLAVVVICRLLIHEIVTLNSHLTGLWQVAIEFYQRVCLLYAIYHLQSSKTGCPTIAHLIIICIEQRPCLQFLAYYTQQVVVI